VTETQGIAHSVHTRLVARSKELHIEAQLLLERYALHRLLYRLSKSQHADRFLLKGAQMMLIWIGESARVGDRHLSEPVLLLTKGLGIR
jgi:hypothetical protein